ncbi:3,9-dihydroxypterocarpan 6A-monooxygenase-like [Neltuma alba]|uniref:3,9-dihydroxypterocarpan 6A-monooxygenase-like n=1 Tax=Neltuma alba TaxID=207710 RepID=UPI0010A53ACC|nr:3,9-dihydroxypterocarpan 6A-monooxygenase-like [Prosopis alba]
MDNDDLRAILMFMLPALLFIILLLSKRKGKAKLPPSPPGLPLIGHFHLLGPLPHRAFHNISQRYGPLLRLSFGSKSCVLVSSPEIARQCLKINDASFLNHPHKTNLDYVTYDRSDIFMAPYGPFWKFMRKLFITQLLSPTTLHHHSPVRAQELKFFLHNLLKKADLGEEVNVGEEVALLAYNIVTTMAFRKRCSDVKSEGSQLVQVVKELIELGGKFNLADMGWLFKKLDLQGYRKILSTVRTKYDAIIERIIKEHEESRRTRRKDTHKEHEAERDLLDILLDIYENPNSEIRLTRENIKAFFLNIFGAGTDTSSLTVTWAMAELMNHPDIMEKARKEIDSVVGKERIVEESDIPNLPYVESIVKETFRLHPTGTMISRQATQECEVNGYVIPEKTSLIVNVWSIGRDPEYWEYPLEFRPERFMNEEGESEMSLKAQNFELLVFGAGRRMCPGVSLATKVVPTTLAAMIQCFQWKLPHEGDVDMEEKPGLGLPRANPLLCIPVPRPLPFLKL